MRTEIISVGIDPVSGTVCRDTWRNVRRVLAGGGHGVSRISVVSPTAESVLKIIKESMNRSDTVVVLGGLDRASGGISLKTAIDITTGPSGGVFEKGRREGERREPESVDGRGRKGGADIPPGSELLVNPSAETPGLRLETGGAAIYLFPADPPVEMLEKYLGGFPPDSHGGSITVSAAQISAAELMDKYRGFLGENAEGIYASGDYPLCDVTFPAKLAAERGSGVIPEGLESYIYSTNHESLEEVVSRLLKKKGKTLAVAESATGGMLASRIISVPGASELFTGGFVTYSNQSKIYSLDVSHEAIEKFGAVSETVCAMMAIGAASRAGADLALSTTGIAGPTGSTKEKKKGLCYIGLKAKKALYCRKYQFRGGRETVRIKAVYAALDLLRLYLDGYTGRLGGPS